ncbi:hypothetical protein ACOJUR_15900 [Alicyclobacillus tolerans]|uniref:hypothetical protein n=1 Tax=Alicyclobacillus tolerans TaxID=90970 RepID=UPI003B80F486
MNLSISYSKLIKINSFVSVLFYFAFIKKIKNGLPQCLKKDIKKRPSPSAFRHHDVYVDEELNGGSIVDGLVDVFEVTLQKNNPNMQQAITLNHLVFINTPPNKIFYSMML